MFMIMNQLFSPEMGALYTWTGKSIKGKKKRVFSVLANIVGVIRGTVGLHFYLR